MKCPNCNKADVFYHGNKGYYCFRCANENKKETKDKVYELSDLIEDLELVNLTEEEFKYLSKYTDEYCTVHDTYCEWDFYHSAKEDRLFLPCYQDEELVYYQLKDISGTRVKYRNPKTKKHFWEYWMFGQATIIVEDIISAIKLWRTQMEFSIEASSIVALLGTYLTDADYLALVNRSKQTTGKILVWLDYNMRTQSLKIVQNFKKLGLPAKSIITEKDPKEYPLQEIVNILKTQGF